jgi:hypothetical protein
MGMDVSMRKNVPRRLNSSNPIPNKAEVDFVPPEEDDAVQADRVLEALVVVDLAREENAPILKRCESALMSIKTEL